MLSELLITALSVFLWSWLSGATVGLFIISLCAIPAYCIRLYFEVVYYLGTGIFPSQRQLDEKLKEACPPCYFGWTHPFLGLIASLVVFFNTLGLLIVYHLFF